MRLRGIALRGLQWLEAHIWPVCLSLVFVLTGWQAVQEPLNGFPGAMWHNRPRGDDIELGQARAATAGLKELLGYWHGPMLHGHNYYRPLASWFFVLQYRLFGTNDEYWCYVSVVAHLALCLLLVWCLYHLSSGARWQRVGVGTLAALLLGAPGLADHSVLFWILGWWPCQPEIFALIFGLALLGGTAIYAETGSRRWEWLAPLYLLAAIGFKEMGFLAGAGAMLMLLRKRRAWPLLPRLGAVWAVMLAVRTLSLGKLAGTVRGATPQLTLQRFGLGVWPDALGLVPLALDLAPLALVAVFVFALRRRVAWPALAIGGVLLYAVLALFISGGGPALWQCNATAFRLLVGVLLAAGFGLACRKWPVPELVPVYLGTLYVGYSFMPVFGHYRYWMNVFGSILAAFSLFAVVQWLLARAAAGSNVPAPDEPAALSASA